ncbi:MAG: tyrosine-type recombinase/integrase [Hyphomicrobiaceae bacterium]
MPRILPFNAATVAAAKAVGDRPTEYRIERVPGLVLLVQPSGIATYFLAYAAGKTRRRLKIGRREAMTLAAARIAAIDALAKVSKGADPVADANAMRTAMTVAQLVEAFLAAPDGPAKSTRAAYKAALYKDIVPNLGDVPAVELTANMVADVLDAIVARGSIVQADRTKAAISSAVTWGIKSRRAIGLQANVCRMLPARASAQPRSRGMADNELAGLWTALDQVTEPVALCARLAWITASRRSEVVGARLCELDLENERWTIPGDTMVKGRTVEGRTKSGQPKIVPLSTEAVAMFRRAIELAGPSCDHIFPAQRGAEKFPHLDPHSISRAIARLRGEAGASDVRLHDGRAACRTWLRDAGYSDTILNAALGHAGTSIGDKHYTAPSLVFIEKQMRPALQAWSSHVANAVGLNPGTSAADNVVLLRA